MSEPPGAGDTGDSGGGGQLPEIRLTRDDRNRLMDVLADIFGDGPSADSLLNRVGFSRPRRPTFTNAGAFWEEIFVELERGILPGAPYRELLQHALLQYSGNQGLNDLARRYGLIQAAPLAQPEPDHTGTRTRPEPEREFDPTPGPTPAPEPAPAPQPPLACHVIIRADSEDDRRAAAVFLTRLGLRPQEVWSTAFAVSFQVNSVQPEVVRDGLGRAPFGWTVVAPGQPDYLYRQLFVEGPDGRQFRFTDAPAQQTNRDVATEIVDQYGAGFADATRSTVIDHVQPDGQGRRLDPDATLHDSNIRDGDRMRIGFETTAGAVNPVDRQDALYRVRNQITAYAESHPGVRVSANSSLLPTEFEVDFDQLSFGPPESPGGSPPQILRHTVLIQLGPGFPETAPEVYWLTPVFHPNVFPNYDCEQSRAYPASKGLVCLGLLAESYQPSLDFGDLCQMLVDMAGFRNYGLYEPTGELLADGRPRVRGNFYDRQAAEWVEGNQERIQDINGSVTAPVPRDAPRYPNVIEPIDDHDRDGT